MSSKFRQDATRHSYTVQTHLWHILGVTLICLFFLVCIATLGAFYVMIDY